MRRFNERRERPAEVCGTGSRLVYNMSYSLTLSTLGFSVLLAILTLSARPVDAVDAMCYDWQGHKVEEGSQYIPKGDDPCMVCVCEKGFPTMCASPSCSPPQCKMFEEVEGKCCEYICVVSPIVPPATNGSGGNVVPNVENKADAASAADLGLRLAASTLTSILILALLLYMIHRLRKRRMLVMMRRLNSPSSERHLQDDTVAYVAGYDEVNIGLAFPPYEEPPPPYTPWKAPDILPPAYDSIANHDQNSSQEHRRRSGGPPASLAGQLPSLPPAGYIAELVSRTASRAQMAAAACAHNSSQQQPTSHHVPRGESEAGNSSTLPLPCSCASSNTVETSQVSQSDINANNESNVECPLVIRDRGPVAVLDTRVERIQTQNSAAPENGAAMAPPPTAESVVVQSTNAADDYVPKGSRSSLVRQSDVLQIRRNSASPRNSALGDIHNGSNDNAVSNNNTKVTRPESTLSGTSCNSENSTERKCGPQRAFIEQREDEIIVWRDRDSPRVSLILREMGNDEAAGALCHDNPVMKSVSPRQLVKSFSSDHEQVSPCASAFNVVQPDPPSSTHRNSLPPNSLDFIFRPIDPDRPMGATPQEQSATAAPNRARLISPKAVPLVMVPSLGRGNTISPSHAIFTPSGPSTRRGVGRSHSITSQMSVASVCSETGEMRERGQQGATAAWFDNASHPPKATDSGTDTLRMQPDQRKHVQAVQSDSQLLVHKACVSNQGNVPTAYETGAMGSSGLEQKDNQHNGTKVKQNHETATAGRSKKKKVPTATLR